MSAICACNASLSNTGVTGCRDLIKEIKKVIFVNRYDSTGTKNYIDPAATLDSTWISGKLNQTDATKRYFPTPEIKNITQEKSEAKYESFNDDSKIFIREGVRTFKGVIPQMPPSYKAKIESIRCNVVDCYLVDSEGNLVGRQIGDDGFLYPIPFNNQSLYAMVKFADANTTQAIDLSFEFLPTNYDGDLRMISGAAFDFDWISDVNGLIDITATYSNKSTTGFKAALKTPYGALNSPVMLEGLVAGDFALFNVTDNASVTISSCTEVDGVYTFTFAAQTSADVLRLTPTKAGYDFTAVVASTITVP